LKICDRVSLFDCSVFTCIVTLRYVGGRSVDERTKSILVDDTDVRATLRLAAVFGDRRRGVRIPRAVSAMRRVLRRRLRRQGTERTTAAQRAHRKPAAIGYAGELHGFDRPLGRIATASKSQIPPCNALRRILPRFEHRAVAILLRDVCLRCSHSQARERRQSLAEELAVGTPADGSEVGPNKRQFRQILGNVEPLEGAEPSSRSLPGGRARPLDAGPRASDRAGLRPKTGPTSRHSAAATASRRSRRPPQTLALYLKALGDPA